ncbi:MAG: ADP-glyceromanno-heptose 6-epimerase [Pseudomonadota bacterium]|nr:ADP-glyceromanno-heptose 6-epimerase [Pseudomonadota bacterium]
MIIVTGANGFIGSAMVWQLNEAGRRDIICVDSVDTKTRPQLLSNKKYQAFQLKDEFLNSLTSGQLKNIDWIIHIGACSSTTETNVEFLRENNTQYTQTLFGWCLKNHVPFIYASSGAVYGAGDLGFDDKSSPDIFKPLNPYGNSKWEFDCWALNQKSAPKNWYGLRFFNVYGPNEYFKGEMASVTYKAFLQVKKSKSLNLFKSHRADYDDGQQKRDFVYVKDVTRWILEIMSKQIPSGIYNMGTGAARSWLDLASIVFSSLETPLKINWIEIPENIRNQYQYFTEAKMQKLFSQGISQPQWSLEDGVKDYVRNYLSKNETAL